MKTLTFSTLACVLTAAFSAAQAPVFVPLSASTAATDVAITNEVVVVGTISLPGSSPILRWTAATGETVITFPGGGSGRAPRISTDGSRILAADIVGTDDTACYFDGAVWTTIPGLPGALGGVKSIGQGITADGSVIVGMGYSAGNVAHPFRWNQSTGLTTDLQPFFSSPTSLANDVDSTGNFIVGYEDNGLRLGARWVGGVRTFFTYLDPSNMTRNVGIAKAVNDAGTIVVGDSIFGSPSIASCWRWSSSTNAITLLPNVPGFGSIPVVRDVSENGSVVVGDDNGGIGNTHAVIWINDQPQDLFTYLNGLGITGMSGYSSLVTANAVSGNGLVIVGSGAISSTPGQPAAGWIVIFPGAVPFGTPYCSGDGAGTACPCANHSAVGAQLGCLNSLATAGKLRGIGQASVTTDTAVLTGSQVPNGPGLYFQGTTQLGGGNGVVFGDGLRCTGGTVIRLGVVQAAGNTSTYPSPNPPAANQVPISLKGLVAGGDVRNYQLWYRDSAAFCSSSVFNVTNGLTVTWQP